MKKYSQYKLFAGPSFIEGMARVLDMGGTLQEYNTSATDAIADTEALRRDWIMVGQDMKKAISRYEQEVATTA